jgi:hypothetical protein
VDSHAAVATADGGMAGLAPSPGGANPAFSDGCYRKDEGESYCRGDEQKA